MKKRWKITLTILCSLIAIYATVVFVWYTRNHGVAIEALMVCLLFAGVPIMAIGQMWRKNNGEVIEE